MTYGGKKLVKNTDYTVSYSKNTAIGQASVKITGKGLYKGTKTVNFNIRPATVTNLKFLPPVKRALSFLGKGYGC